MTTFHTIALPGGRLIVNLQDVVSVQEVTSDDLDRGICMRLRNGDSYLIKDPKREFVDEIMAAAQGWPDREEY